MKKSTIVWLVIAAALILAGGMTFGCAMTMINWDFAKLSTDKYETREHEITDEFQNISVLADTADVTFLPSDGTECRVVCYEQTNVSHAVAVKDGTLMVEVIDTRKWYEYIGFNFQTPKVTVYMPKGEYAALTIKTDTGDVSIPREYRFKSMDVSLSTGDVICKASTSSYLLIKTSTGNITLQDVSADILSLTVSTGKITASGVTCESHIIMKVSTGKSVLTDVTCQSLTSSGDTGDIKLTRVMASQMMSVVRTTGDVTFDASDAPHISVTTSTGDVEGTLLSDKVFYVETDTGRRKYPHMTTGGKCQITTSTGDIEISIER